MINGPPKVVRLAIDLHEDLVDVPTLLGVAFHSADPLAFDIGCKHWSEPVPL